VLVQSFLLAVGVTNTVRCNATPCSHADINPKSLTPTTANQDPACVAALTISNAVDIAASPLHNTVRPRTNAPSGIIGCRAFATGSE
jgi:hypothetical protein